MPDIDNPALLHVGRGRTYREIPIRDIDEAITAISEASLLRKDLQNVATGLRQERELAIEAIRERYREELEELNEHSRNADHRLALEARVAQKAGLTFDEIARVAGLHAAYLRQIVTRVEEDDPESTLIFRRKARRRKANQKKKAEAEQRDARQSSS